MFAIEEKIGTALCGSFTPTEAYEAYRAVFEEHASRVNAMSLAYVDEIEDQIREIGIYAVSEGVQFCIYDTQIFGMQGSFRLADR